ncbi:MAG TPA: sensor histidine kinase [Cyclobacteriaceae bacterium]|jgi:sensor histidine kinase YesM|nr:sensor histidine kinase [Cyclobacteriaceae bacterium]
MTKTPIVRNRILLLHVSFWVLYASYRVFDSTGFLGLEKAFLYTAVSVFIKILASYVHFFLVLPIWLDQKSIGRYFRVLLVLLAAVVTFRIAVENRVMAELIPNESYFKSISLARVVSSTWDLLAFMVFISLIRVAFDRFDLEAKQKQLRNEKLTAELNYLKAQINPHFLFNTLHNLNYLIYSKSTAATDVVVKLSNIMRYMIYDASKNSVPLLREIDLLNDYIHLESIRLNEKFDLQFEKQGDVASAEIAPLMLLTLLENAFKHGVRDGEKDCWVKIDLRVDRDKISYRISNRIVASDPTKLKSGFGLNNLVQRLELSYPGKYSLDIEDENSIYCAKLVIRL